MCLASPGTVRPLPLVVLLAASPAREVLLQIFRAAGTVTTEGKPLGGCVPEALRGFRFDFPNDQRC